MEFIIRPMNVVDEVKVPLVEVHVILFSEVGMLIRRVTVYSIKKVISNHLTPWNTQEASFVISRLLARFSGFEDPTILLVEDLTYRVVRFWMSSLFVLLSDYFYSAKFNGLS